MEQGTEILAPSLVAICTALALVRMVFDLRLAFPCAPRAVVVPPSAFLGLWLPWWRSVYVHLPGQSWAYPLGLCLHGFLLTYLALVSWRWHRDGKRPNPSLQGDASPQSGSRPELRR